MKRKSILISSLTDKMLSAHETIQDYSIQQFPALVGNYEKLVTNEELVEAKALFNVTKKRLLDLLI